MRTTAADVDAVIRLDETRAVEPLERTPRWTPELPEAYPLAVQDSIPKEHDHAHR